MSDPQSSDPINLNLHKEEHRFKTFSSFPKERLQYNPSALALIGFYYTKSTDELRCRFCPFSFQKWEPEDGHVQPSSSHPLYCPLMKRQETANIPLDSEKLDRVLTIYEHFINPTKSEPKYSKYQTESQRLKTFQGWPQGLKQRPEELAEAGFFYTGKRDKVDCFSCGLSLKEWEQQDNVWHEHAKHGPECTFLTLMRGKKFIEDAQKGMNKEKSLQHDAKPLNENDYREMGLEIYNKKDNKKDNNRSADAPVVHIEEGKKCENCSVEPAQVFFLPCGHTKTCPKCSDCLTQCPCGAEIKENYVLYFC